MSESDTEKVVQLDKAKRAKAQLASEGADARRDVLDLPPNDPVLNGMEAGNWPPGPDGLPPHTPVTPLGFEGDNFVVLTGRCTVMHLPPKMGKGDIDAAFTPYANFPVWAWPRKVKQGNKFHVRGNFDAERVRAALFKACALKGPWESEKRQRGVGAWADESGRLILHLGDEVVTPAGAKPPGLIDDHVYPAAERSPRPGPFEPIEDGTDGHGARLLSHFRTWNWARGDLDALLLLGWLFLAPIGGALRWRPYVYVSGDAGTGKTTMVNLIEYALNGLLLRSEDATEAGVAQTLGHDAKPCLLDELENEIDNNGAEKIIRLTRRAASGNQRLRGGSDHKASSFTIRSCFFLSGINMPTMDAADLSRSALLALRPFPKGTPRRRFDAAEIAAHGSALFGRAVHWWRQDAEEGVPVFELLLERVRERLMSDLGHDDRGADTFGYLMAGAWMALHDHLPEIEELRAFIPDGLARDQVAEYEAIKPTWRKAVDWMLGVAPKALERNTYRTVRHILEAWRDGEIDATAVKRQLRQVGLTLHWFAGQPQNFDFAQLFVPNSDPLVAELFARTKWRTSDMAGEGGWKSALRGGPGDWIRVSKVRNGTKHPVRGTSLRIGELVGYQLGSPFRDEEDFEPASGADFHDD